MDPEGAQKYFHLLILELMNFSKNSNSAGDLQVIDSTFHNVTIEKGKRQLFICKGYI